jgi:hypothetical protein
VIRREHFCNKLRELKYKYKRETERVLLYKRSNDPVYVMVPRRDLLDDDYVRIQLKQSGCSKEDIETFLTTYRLQ